MFIQQVLLEYKDLDFEIDLPVNQKMQKGEIIDYILQINEKIDEIMIVKEVEVIKGA